MEAPGTITKEKLSKLTGIPVARLRQLAADGFFSKAIEGNYKLTEAIQGLFRYYKESSEKLPVYDSIEACSGATGIPRALLKAAKKQGCLAFKSNRVDLSIVLRWAFSPASEGAGNWDDKYKEFRAKREQQKFAREDGATIRTVDAERAGAVMLGLLGRVLRQKLCNDLPSATAGKHEPEIRKANGLALDDAFTQAREKHREAIEAAKKNEDDELAS